jgi:hypothetical protein
MIVMRVGMAWRGMRRIIRLRVTDVRLSWHTAVNTAVKRALMQVWHEVVGDRWSRWIDWLSVGGSCRQ